MAENSAEALNQVPSPHLAQFSSGKGAVLVNLNWSPGPGGPERGRGIWAPTLELDPVVTAPGPQVAVVWPNCWLTRPKTPCRWKRPGGRLEPRRSSSTYQEDVPRLTHRLSR